MKATQTNPTTTNPTTETTRRDQVVVPFSTTSGLAPRERDFGIGYGKSSGYATSRRYVTENASRTFRVA